MMPANRRLSQDDRFSSIVELKAAEYFAVPAISAFTIFRRPAQGEDARQIIPFGNSLRYLDLDRNTNQMPSLADWTDPIAKTCAGMPSTHAKRGTTDQPGIRSPRLDPRIFVCVEAPWCARLREPFTGPAYP